MIRPVVIALACAVLIPTMASAQLATHCTQCLSVQGPTLDIQNAWQLIQGSTQGTPYGEWTYPFCAVGGGQYQFSFCQQGGNAAWDTALSIWTPSGAMCGTQLACNDDTCGLQSELTWTAPANGTYLIQVDGFADATGPYVLAYRGQPCQATPVEASTWGAIKSTYNLD